jgi:chemotaxis protein MotB
MSNRGTISSCKKGAPLWMTTFADLMSLLMALFVLLFAMSSMERHKFDEIAKSFRLVAGGDITSQKIDSPEGSPESQLELKPLYESIIETYATSINNEEMKVAWNNEDVIITFPGEIAFESGSADLKRHFQFLLRRFSMLSYQSANQIEILGHTDSNPIQKGARFRSNWELSGSRAAAVGEYLLSLGYVSPDKLKILGMADTKKISKDNSENEMKKDRRVEIIIHANRKIS